MPMYYHGYQSIILAVFKDHINIVSNQLIHKNQPVFPNAILANKDLLSDFKITPKGMLQIYVTDTIPKDALTIIFKETFEKGEKNGT